MTARAGIPQRLVARLSPEKRHGAGDFPRRTLAYGVICALGQTINDLFAYGPKWRAERLDRDEHLPDFCVVSC